MSAYFDKSQGITFVYSNIHELYKKAKTARLDSPFVVDAARASQAAGLMKPAARAPESAQARVLKAEDLAKAKIEAFRPEEIKPAAEERPYEVPMGVREADEKAKRLSMRPVAQLQKNLSELNDAQAKLRFLLQELEGLTKKKS